MDALDYQALGERVRRKRQQMKITQEQLADEKPENVAQMEKERDATKAALAQMEDFPVYARAITPNGPYKNGPGEIGTTIAFGGKVVRPGDIIVGDADGIVVIRPEEAEELAQKARKVLEMENGILEKILNEGTYSRPWVDEKLQALGCQID